MEFFYDLWTFAPDWQLKLLLLAVVAQFILTIRLFGVVSKGRMKAGKEGRVTTADYAVVTSGKEPEDLAVLARALNNQFELPLLFYALVFCFVTTNIETWLTVLLAWAFVATRWLHAQIMITTNRVMRRRRMFIYGIYIFMAMLAEFVIRLLFFAEL